METLWAWSVFGSLLLRYLVYKTGRGRRPMFTDRLDAMPLVGRQVLRWNRLRVVNPEQCPQAYPAVFVGNHIGLDDPNFIWPAIYYSSGRRVVVHFMMRDDFFRGFPWDFLPINVDDLAEMCGAVRISRDSVQWSQLKPFLTILETPGAFLMFPGRTRSRSGLPMEYREGIEEPGGTSFFVMHAQRRMKQPVPAVPIARTTHPVTKRCAVAFGAPLYLDAKADRATQREFDQQLPVHISNLIEIHVPHLVCAMLYLHCLQQGNAPLKIDALTNAVKSIAGKLDGRFVDPNALTRTEDEVRQCVRWLRRSGMLRLSGTILHPDVAKVLFAPALDTKYRKRNPVKFYANQILPLTDVVARIEDTLADLR